MTAVAKINRRAPKGFTLRFWQTPAKLARLNCTGFTAEVGETTLPFNLTVLPVNLAQGEWRIVAPTEAQAELLVPGTAYRIAIVLRNAGSEPVEDMQLTVMAE
jgi:hypothetical protein